VVDTVCTVETPEGVRLTLRAAGPVPRALAYLMDAFLRGIFYMSAFMGLAVALGDLAGPLMLLILFLGEWFYPVFFEVWAGGQTLGKKVVGLRVVREDGTRVRWSASILRNLLLAADWLPGTYAAGLVSSLASPGFRRLGDLAAGTLVIHLEERGAAPAPPPRVVPIPPPRPLSVEEQRAVVAFSERASLFSEARADELAALATPLHAGAGSPRERLLGAGAWLLGRTAGGGS
jgi:uncharacterized RDD family membrane protein YckC